ncbi:hypothetical protein FBU59_001750 [Linderina macrospora]|uniref:Uncharacterized protein n=1 Tax=Linderina macrospora TaxID=4868 RepID=A0ACC1JD51_9FUNG|nr:hypothetical protein FBU59_001750 [Linderina macrospora]
MSTSPVHSTGSGSPTRRRASPTQVDTQQRVDYDEVLESEVFIDVNKLRKYARHGIPDDLRAHTSWKLTTHSRKKAHATMHVANEFTQRKARLEAYQEIDKENVDVSKRVRGEVNRFLMRTKKDSLVNPHSAPAVFEAVICAYINCNNHIDYSPALVQMCAPFVATMKDECDVYSGFERLADIMYESALDNNINKRVALFLSYFRTMMPELYNYFEEEDVDVGEWASSWLRYLLAKEMPIRSLLRLWDVYFSMPDFVEFHSFVCLGMVYDPEGDVHAILKHLKDSLEDLEQSEIRSVLLRLPQMNISQVINQAYNIRSEIQARYGNIGGLGDSRNGR